MKARKHAAGAELSTPCRVSAFEAVVRRGARAPRPQDGAHQRSGAANSLSSCSGMR